MHQLPDPLAARYSVKEFSEYRFIPGANPHPTEDPTGHSYGTIVEAVSKLDNKNWFRNETYLYGIDLYNFVYWWESHEAFENLWRGLRRESLEADFLQGLIKISAAFLKWHAREQRGIEILYSGGVELLKDVCQEKTIFMGINLMEHIAKVSNHFRSVIADPAVWPDPLKNYPFIVLTRDVLSGREKFSGEM